MDSIVNKLTEIEDAASAIVQHAEDQKEALDKEYEEKRKAFDAELEEKPRPASVPSGKNWSRTPPAFSTARAVRATPPLMLFRRNMTSVTRSMPARF